MTLLLTLLIMAVLGLVVAVATGRLAGGLDRAASSLPGEGLPSGPIGAADVERVRFSPALRGYRMDEVDDVLDRLTEELRRRDEEIAELRRRSTSRPRDADGGGPPGRPDAGDEAGPALLDDAYETHGLPGNAAEAAALWRRPANGARPQSPSPPRGIPARPPAGRHDEHGGGR